MEPFLVASSLVDILAQRLVRTLCPSCKQAYQPNATELDALGLDVESQPVFYHATGCDACKQQGYRGRIGIYELINVDATLRQMIHDGAGEQKLEAHARLTQPSLFRDGVRRILDGDTSVEEVLRVTQEK